MLFTLQIIAIFLTPLFLSAAENEWELKLNKHDITVYTRKCEESRFKEFLAITEMKGSIKDFSEIIMDIEGFIHWTPDCKTSKIIERIDKSEVISHVKMEVPFPFSDRDMVQKLKLVTIDNGIRVDISSQPDLIAEVKKHVRIPYMKGFWEVKQVEEGIISVHFQCLTDPGGDLPAWLVNMFIVYTPYETLLNMRGLIEGGS